MRNLLFVIIVVIVAIVAYFVLTTLGGPESAYQKFAEAWGEGDTATALQYADPSISSTISTLDVNKVTRYMMDSLMGVKITIDYANPDDTGGVNLRATVSLLYNPPGVHSAMYATMAANVEHVVTLKKIGGSWKVSSFEPKLLGVAELPKPGS